MKARWQKAAVGLVVAAGLLVGPFYPSISEASGTASAVQANEQDIRLWADGEWIKLEAPIYKERGVAMAPMKELIQALGARSTYESKSSTLIISDIGVAISLTVGSDSAFVNGNRYKMPAAAVNKSGTIYLPIRFISEYLDADVVWDAAGNAIKLSSWRYSGAMGEEIDQVEVDAEPLEPLTARDIAEFYDESVVMITTNTGVGSGIVIGEQLILTNHHVIEDAASATALSIYDEEYEISGVVVSSPWSDLAIISTKEDMGLLPVQLEPVFVEKGSKVFAIGSPRGVQNSISEGIVANYRYEAGGRYIQFNAPIDHGSSGGALFNEYGQLIGVPTFKIANTTAQLNYAVPIYQAVNLYERITEEDIAAAVFYGSILPDTLVGAPLSDITKLLTEEFASVDTSKGMAELSKWEAKRDAQGWLVLSANIDPLFYLYYGSYTEPELRLWSINLGHELHRMLPKEKIQVVISFDRVYGFQPRDFAPGEVTQTNGGNWRVRYTVIDMQLQDQMYIKTRF